MSKHLDRIYLNAYIYIIQITHTKTYTMKTQQEKAEILEMAEDFRMVDECNESEIKSDFFYLRKAMSWKPVAEKRSNKLSECMGRHNEVMNQRYNHNTRSYEKF